MTTATTPPIQGIDHVHVYTRDRAAARDWFARVLGYDVVADLEHWSEGNGPLTLENPEGNVHLALFQRDDVTPSTALAFGAQAEAFLAWRAHLEAQGLELRIADHDLAWSMYFYDPDGNYHEITTYDCDVVTAAMPRETAP